MPLPNENDLGYYTEYTYTQYSHDKDVNVIPQKDFQRLVMDTFETIAENLRNTYGPYASQILMTDSSGQTETTKDGYNTFCALGFSHQYKQLVYRAIRKIIDRVNKNVGDGTTSCILLAEKMFSELQKVMTTPDHARKLLNALTELEDYLQSRDAVIQDRKKGIIGPLTDKAMKGLVNMAGNYDEKLRDVLVNALDPTYAETDDPETRIVQSIKNVEVSSSVMADTINVDKLKLSELPGDFRISVNIESEIGLLFQEGMKVKVVLYDHEFSDSDWNLLFTDKYDKITPTLVLTRRVNRGFKDGLYTRYCKQVISMQSNVTVYLAEVVSDYTRDTINDLAHVLDTVPVGVRTVALNHDELPFTTVTVVNGWIMCFDKICEPKRYIEALKDELENSPSQSMIRHKEYTDRINALENLGPSSLITMTAASSLESKMLSDKIDDCLAIVRSACDYGIVPNILTYGYDRIKRYKAERDDELVDAIADAIMRSINGLFDDIWHSKHLDQYDEKRRQISEALYAQIDSSFDILEERFIPKEALPTSAQYDLEVIAAAISIVKYLLTSKAMIFDAHLMRPVTDSGNYVPYPR